MADRALVKRILLPLAPGATGAAVALMLALAIPAQSAQSSTPSNLTLDRQLRTEIRARGSSSFEGLLKDWEARYGAKAVPSLVKIVSARGNADGDRYVALMGAAKLGGAEAAPVIAGFLQDKSWMIRSASLRALSALRNPATASAVLPLLNDPALVVRLEAVYAVQQLQPAGAAEALVETLEHGANYHHGKAQWVPQKALEALIALRAREVAPRLKPLLDHEEDPELQRLTVSALESLTGRSFKKPTLGDQVREWKIALARKG